MCMCLHDSRHKLYHNRASPLAGKPSIVSWRRLGNTRPPPAISQPSPCLPSLFLLRFALPFVLCTCSFSTFFLPSLKITTLCRTQQPLWGERNTSPHHGTMGSACSRGTLRILNLFCRKNHGLQVYYKCFSPPPFFHGFLVLGQKLLRNNLKSSPDPSTPCLYLSLFFLREP